MTLPNDALVDDNNDDDDGADAVHRCEEEGEEENMKAVMVSNKASRQKCRRELGV